MEHALAVVGPTDGTKALVREAGKFAAGVGAELTLLHVTTEDDYTEQRQQLEDVSNAEASYSVGQALQGARKYAEDIGRETLSDVAVDYEAVGLLGDKADTVLSEADRRGCDHVFIGGRQRSPTGKALFGDATQRVLLEFDGPVTVVTE